MRLTRRTFLGDAALFAAGSALGAGRGGPREANPYESPDGQANDSVWLRRVYVDLAGHLPSAEAARAFVGSAEPDKRQRLVERLLASDAFADYWSMRFCDILRVKSEFPVNLWPNAVYVYHRRIRNFVRTDEPWDRLARALLVSSGSNFRDAESNFYRATALRTPQGFAEAAALTFLGEDWRKVPGADLRQLAAYFDCIRIKNTREWKEEIVFTVGEDRRGAFCDRLLAEWRRPFAAAFVQRVDWWLFRRRKSSSAHVDAFLRGGFRLKPLLREIALSADYARGPITGAFPFHRLDAEVLDDAICDLTGLTRSYQSIAPEPFTFLPSERRTVAVEDGSITSAFLLLFGRPARDSGRLSERSDEISAKQRLYLFNSGRLYQAIGNLLGRADFKGRPVKDVIDELYWRFYARPAAAAERRDLLARFNSLPKGRERWSFSRDLAWALLNSREFLYQH